MKSLKVNTQLFIDNQQILKDESQGEIPFSPKKKRDLIRNKSLIKPIFEDLIEKDIAEPAQHGKFKLNHIEAMKLKSKTKDINKIITGMKAGLGK